MTLKQIDGVIADVETAVKASEYIEKRDDILKDMHDTIGLQSEINKVAQYRATEMKSERQKGAYRYHGINTQFKQFSTNTSRKSFRRKYPLGIR